MNPSAFTYAAAAEALGLPSDRRLRKDAKKGRLKIRRLGHRTALITFDSLQRWAENRGLKLNAA